VESSEECFQEKMKQDNKLTIKISVLILCGIIIGCSFAFAGFIAGLYTNMTGITHKIEYGCNRQCNGFIDKYCSCNPAGDFSRFNFTGDRN